MSAVRTLAAWYWARPWLTQRESDLDIALLVEKQHHIDNDLVAALEFESPEAASWGSSQLEAAVVRYVADFSKQIKLEDGLPATPIRGPGRGNRPPRRGTKVCFALP